MKLFRLEWLVFAVAAILLSYNLWNTGIASGSIDPILHFGAQDEATYTREAITMARDGGWMTPTFLGRWVFEKPPLLMWLSAMSMKIFGIGRLSARLPSVLAGALICALCFAMVRRKRSLGAALAVAAMAVSSQVLFTMSRHNMTDILLAASGVTAFAIVLRDPELAEWRSVIGFVVAAAAGMMAKSIAGILVVAVMFVVVGVGRRRWMRAVVAGVGAMVIASPWFLYNFVAHREWFLADMGFQIITIGTNARQTAQENHLWFYLRRIFASDAVPLVLALCAMPAVVRGWKRREPAAWLSVAYVVIYFAALMVFHFHSEQYLCWFVPSLILMAGFYSPLLEGKAAGVVVAIAAVAFGIKIGMPDVDDGVFLRSLLSRYCGERRATDLYILGVDDEFYSAVLPLYHVHYGWIDASDTVAREHPHLADLGILIPAAEFAHVDEKMYADRLRAWGLDSTRPIGSGISAHDAAELRQIIRQHPESDFLVSHAVLPEPEKESSHRVAFNNGEFALLETVRAVGSEAPAWSCEM